MGKKHKEKLQIAKKQISVLTLLLEWQSKRLEALKEELRKTSRAKRSGAEPLGDLKGHLCPSSQKGIYFPCEVKNKKD
ncbi:hypothetical protein B6S12_09750 [Helicobacter valdiviensis]|uniref:Uncharacterized protein n=1 Tax=Helicobacter valdiviensis TaxID=1458358 RepID=A0A2W6MRZ7_9HELI|nr:hypothetical protein [Helicobacter valdiviensis]PZT47307.1 hypothetical protein B6S12_09750 [Helicobacter valdiviensis]